MPRSSRKKSSKSRSASGRRRAAKSRASNGNGRKGTDAISLLKADHREVEGWFSQFEKSRSDSQKQQLATKICNALKAHTTIEEEIFYPAFLEATEEKDLHHEAEIEHGGAKKLIAEIEAAGPHDDYFDARVSVLSEMIKHHVNEEEQRGGMFAKARSSDMDLEALGQKMQKRKSEVMGELESDEPERGAWRQALERNGIGRPRRGDNARSRI
jgi:hemerythrin superfamily protein